MSFYGNQHPPNPAEKNSLIRGHEKVALQRLVLPARPPAAPRRLQHSDLRSTYRNRTTRPAADACGSRAAANSNFRRRAAKPRENWMERNGGEERRQRRERRENRTQDGTQRKADEAVCSNFAPIRKTGGVSVWLATGEKSPTNPHCNEMKDRPFP